MKNTTKNVLFMLKESNAIEEVYDSQSLLDSYDAWDYLMSQDELTPSIIKETHQILMAHQNILDEYKGDWRTRPVTIGGETKTLPKIVIQSLIEDLCESMNKSELNYDPINFHIQFENIHPFYDGNGRTGRLILNWHLVKKFNAPLLVYTEKEKQVYYMLFSSYRRKVMDNMWKTFQEEWKKELDEK